MDFGLFNKFGKGSVVWGWIVLKLFLVVECIDFLFVIRFFMWESRIIDNFVIFFIRIVGLMSYIVVVGICFIF